MQCANFVAIGKKKAKNRNNVIFFITIAKAINNPYHLLDIHEKDFVGVSGRESIANTVMSS